MYEQVLLFFENAKKYKSIVYLSKKYIFAKKSKKISLTTGQFNTKYCLTDTQGCYVGKLAGCGS